MLSQKPISLIGETVQWFRVHTVSEDLSLVPITMPEPSPLPGSLSMTPWAPKLPKRQMTPQHTHTHKIFLKINKIKIIQYV